MRIFLTLLLLACGSTPTDEESTDEEPTEGAEVEVATSEQADTDTDTDSGMLEVAPTLEAPPTEPRDARCAHLDQVWKQVPDAHRRCAGDTDCGVVGGAAGCMHVALHALAVPVYERFRDEHDVPCEYAATGMCPGEGPTASCVEGLCTLSGP